jgi:O-antigen/teichoic acid export membrane protein
MSPAPGPSGRLPRVAAWTFGGQALSSASNFVVTLWALATLPGRQFALFSLCITTFLLVTQLSRALVSTPVLVLYADGGEPGGPPAALGAGVAFGAAASLVLAMAAAVAAAVAGTGAIGPFLVLAAALPALQYQDVLRHVCIARHRPQAAAASDAAWLVLQLAGFAALDATGGATATTIVAVWAGAGAAAGLGAGAALGLAPRVRRALRWWRANGVLCRRLACEFAANAGSYYVVAYGLAVVSGAAQLGHLRAAQALFGPVSVLLLGGTVLGIPESVRAVGDGATLRRLTVRLSTGLAGIALMSGAALFVLLPIAGPRLLPGAWQTARPLIPALTVFGAGIGASAGALAGLRALADGRWIVVAQGVRGTLAVALGLAAAAQYGAAGALAGLALAEWLFATAAWSRLLDRRPARRPATARGAGSRPDLERIPALGFWRRTSCVPQVRTPSDARHESGRVVPHRTLTGAAGAGGLTW